ncbi:sulfite exporter TauE/SafE family protein [Tropicimonas sp.]|uniref:sulfite exporter TauE/SafE family protein n=1 Tax=Tropicimonas sp. TaxID=2067044 RepID=UPI003A860D7C
MDSISVFAGLSLPVFALAFAVAFLGGFVKGAVGFAMPMIMISGLASFMAPELALAGLILPTVLSNLLQAFRGGIAAAWRAVRAIRVYLIVGGVLLIASAQLVRSVDERFLYLLIGLPVTVFGLIQLAGFHPRVPPRYRFAAEVGLGAVSGVVGGISGVWGPPLVLYLTSVDTPKTEQLRTLGVAFALGAVLLLATHLQTGVLNRATLPFSAAMAVPAMGGVYFGLRLHDRLDQARFRRLTLLVLIVAGLNLLRRAAF